MIHEDLLSVKLSREIELNGYRGTLYGKDRRISVYCAKKWLRENYKIDILTFSCSYPIKFRNWLIYMGEPIEKDDKLDMCDLPELYDTYKQAAIKGIEYGLRIAKEINKARNEVK